MPQLSFNDLERASVDSVDAVRRMDGVLRSAKAGNTEAFTELVRSLQSSVFRWALTFARDADEADELTQETFVQVHRKLDQYRGDSSLDGWVYGITRNLALQTNRKKKRRTLLSVASLPGIETVYNTDPGARVDRQRVADYIRHFFLELPPRQREVFDLVDLQGFDPAEVADLIGMKAATVRANLFKARAAIRAHLLAVHPEWSELK
ncbi:MAG TPA: RNA polymerase sigma factor [Gemmatimonadaceae bacterium]|nr:RNA polymerase sigma factor [Gemmatimonadaceae bacterium]